jgi:hypothetical protein
MEDGAQQLAQADHTIENSSEVCFVIGAYQFKICFTAPAVWRLSSPSFFPSRFAF